MAESSVDLHRKIEVFVTEADVRTQNCFGHGLPCHIAVFTFANIVTPATSTTNLTVPYYSNDPVLIAAMEDPENGPGLTPGAWSSEPLEIDMRGSGIIKGLYEALLGCREGDYVESYMTYNMAYGDINFSTIPKESPVAYFFTVNSVE